MISKKVHKSAVGRNRARRRIYEIIREELPQMEAVHDVVVIVSSAEVLSTSPEDLKKQLTQLFNQSGLYAHP